MTDTPHQAPATFCWVDLSTTDQDAAKGFYTAVFGWTTEDVPSAMGPAYTLFSQDAKVVSGAYPLAPDQGDHPFWLGYVCVADLEATLARAQSLGAQVACPPMDIMDKGRLALFQDPTGAFLGLWQPLQHRGFALFNAPGAASWFELQTRDTAAAAAFYQGLFGWTVRPFAGYLDGAYQILVLDGREVGGMVAIGADWGQVPPNWSVYFGVRDCDATVAKTEWLGGKVLCPAMAVAGVGRFAHLQDPQGAVFAVIARAQG
jgi:uncharacterized protein